MAADDAEWVEDMLVEVFNCPSWEVPIMTFIDTNAPLFEEGDENKLVYTNIHKEFCELVEQLLEQHLADIGMDAERFVEICMAAKGNKEFQTLVVDQILAMDDFLTFKKLMIKRNAELHVEALQAERARMAHHVQPQPSAPLFSTDEEAEAIKMSLELYKQDLSVSKTEDADFEEALQASLLDAEMERRQMELEIASLEAAIAASLVLEEERLRREREQHTVDAPVVNTIAAVNEKSNTLSMETPASAPVPAPVPAPKASVATQAMEILKAPAMPEPTAAVLAEVEPAKPSQPTHTHTSELPIVANQHTTETRAFDSAVSMPRDITTKVSASDSSSIVASADARPTGKSLPAVITAPVSPTARAALPSLVSKPRIDARDMTFDNFLVECRFGSGAEDEEDLELQRRKAAELFEANKERLKNMREAALSSLPSGITEEELKRRADHLKQQRDLLIAKKNADRAQQLEVHLAAKKAVDESHSKADGAGPIVSTGASAPGGSAEEKRIAMRRALAAKMKADLEKH